MVSALSIGSFCGRTCIEVHGEDITPEEAEGWSASGKRIKKIMAGKENGESAAITRQSRPKPRASFAKRVAASVTKAARMPIDMPKEETKVVMRPKTEASIITSVVRTAARVTKEEAKADTICTNAQQNVIVVSTPDERLATVYSKVKALNRGSKTYEISAYKTPLDGTVKGVIRGIAVDDTPEEIAENIKRPWARKMEAMQQQPDPESSPPRRASPAERPRGESKQRDSSRNRDDSKIGRSASRRRPSQSRERGSWSDVVKANMAEKRQPPALNATKKIQEANGVEKALRDENEKLKRRIAEHEASIKEINEKLTALIAMQQQQQQPTPAQQRKQEMTEDEPEVEVDPRAAMRQDRLPRGES
ncbi:hypothetical protein HPB49_007909 [Dermacentor silvarum]|uniref:Uncharacterized protein n=1 Tax=Dermacentor silvarum TaxID=543639 RepID=A0ACB8DNL9_DERSI|nr:hypothetical protein HPB49_007909 [Dermacentor silvarum]